MNPYHNKLTKVQAYFRHGTPPLHNKHHRTLESFCNRRAATCQSFLTRAKKSISAHKSYVVIVAIWNIDRAKESVLFGGLKRIDKIAYRQSLPPSPAVNIDSAEIATIEVNMLCLLLLLLFVYFVSTFNCPLWVTCRPQYSVSGVLLQILFTRWDRAVLWLAIK